MSVYQQKLFNYEYKIAIKELKMFLKLEDVSQADDWESPLV